MLFDLEVEHGKEAYHSGLAGGIVPDTFRIIRSLLDRLEDCESGEMMEELQVECPFEKGEEAHWVASYAGSSAYRNYTLVENGQYIG